MGLTVAACPAWFDAPGPVYALAAVFAVGNAVASARGWVPGMHRIGRRSWGTAVFPLALVVALALCWSLDAGRVFVLQTAFVVLALADPAASLVGERWGRGYGYSVAGATKSVAGSAAFAVVAAVATAATLAALSDWPPTAVASGALAVAVLATAAEALGRAGWDNLWVVLAVVVPLSALDAAPEAAGRHAVAVAGAVAFGVAAVRARFLDVSGALAGSLLAWMLVALGGAAWAAPALAFFVLSSALSKLGRAADGRTEKGSRRDAGQVLANGGVAMALLAATVFVEWGALYPAFVGAFAAAAADTWATELGTRARGETRLLALGPVVPPGTSGGMSLAGTAGAVVGAGSVVGAAALFGPPGASASGALAAVAVAASVVDSALGATVQRRYRGADGALVERPGAPGEAPAAGWRFVGNDAVNWAGTVAGALGAAAVWAA